MSCDKCQSIKKVIKVPRDLKEAILLAKLKIEDGTLKYLGAGAYGDPFKRIASGQGWSDFVNNYFSCSSCYQVFNLHAETYHGSGGKLEAVEEIQGELSNDVYPT
ncbi:hypothetical protein [Pseudoalteromonas rubra]|uniref:hypothetical protein n=1 Tax=Pseudoalteromonas rubra TaxID=43658 RepID=UPI00026CBA8F|nr:hypothetical protein [Pseudoalteromonas rubra]